MTRHVFLLLYALAISVNAFAVDIDLQEVIDAGLPVMYVETVNGELPTYRSVSSPPGMNGTGITDATKVPGRVRIELKDGTILFDSGEYEAKTSGMTIKVRGNTSAHEPKKPFKIKLQKKADMLVRGDDAKYADKNWILVKDESLKYKFGFKVNELMGLQWTPQYRYVNLVFNGEYRGVYMLLESVERNTKCRLDVDKSGYIFELDAYWWNEDKYFSSSLSPQMNYTYKYPDPDDLTEEQNDYIQHVVDVAEASLTEGTYPDYLDIESFAQWVLGHDILGNAEPAGSNIFFTKYDNTDESKIRMANLWDFDKVMLATGWDHAHNNYYWSMLFKSPNKAFGRCYKKLWNELKTTVFDDLDLYLDEFANSEEAAAFDKSIELDNQRWNRSIGSTEQSISTIKSWLEKREPWLEYYVTTISDKDATGIAEVRDTDDTEPIYYTLTGLRVEKPTKGIYIRNGVKYVNW